MVREQEQIRRAPLNGSRAPNASPPTDWEWELIRRECTGCGICVDVCPHAALTMPRELAYPEPVPQACVGCLDCVQECPVDAIVVRPLAATRSEVSS